MGSDGPKKSVPQWGIEPWSLTFRVSIITTRPPRQLSAVTETLRKYQIHTIWKFITDVPNPVLTSKGKEKMKKWRVPFTKKMSTSRYRKGKIQNKQKATDEQREEN